MKFALTIASSTGWPLASRTIPRMIPARFEPCASKEAHISVRNAPRRNVLEMVFTFTLDTDHLVGGEIRSLTLIDPRGVASYAVGTTSASTAP